MHTLWIVVWTVLMLLALSNFGNIAALYGLACIFPEGRNWRITTVFYTYVLAFILLVALHPF